MSKYNNIFTDKMNSGELRLAYLTELKKCNTPEERKELLEVYQPFSDEAISNELAQKDLMTSY